jgi:hypothetical protein
MKKKQKEPYFAKRKIVVFATNDKWINSLKKRIPNIVCYDEKSKSDYSSKIRESDVIWYFTKIKKHANQDKLLVLTRKYKKRLLFFNFKGPNPCAEEIILFEEEGKYNSRYY